ncbi:MAG: DUF488 domain-containing protein [Caulobacteraceae bacterium]|nr:DUF488 domain-containing protein [Caulobacteraceae bacterium]
MPQTPPLATIGYEAATLTDVIGRLKGARVNLLIDVRAIAASRRPGFSKTMFAASLAEVGIDYLHLRALGTPKAGREAARAGRTQEMREIYEAHLEEPDAQTQLVQATQASERRRTALLCYEADAARCHRRIVAERISAVTGAEVTDL